MNGGGCYSGLSKKRSFLGQLSRKFTSLPRFSFCTPVSCAGISQFPHNLSSCQKILIFAPTVSVLGILVLASTLFISSDLASSSYALDGTNLNSEITAEINGTHYITLSAPDVAFSITPDTSDPGTTIGLDTTKVDVSVETNAIGGAELYLSTSSNTNALYKDGNVNNSNLPSIDASLSTTSNPTTLDNLATNTWGYSLDNTNYSGVPTIESPNHITSIDGVNTGTTSSGIISATIPIYYAAKVDISIPSGSYANSVTYSAVVDGGIVTSAELTSITINNSSNQPEVVEQLQLDTVNTVLVTTNLKTNTYGTPRVYYTGTAENNSDFYSECTNVVVSSNADGYMTIQCEVTPTTIATGLTLHIVPKGTPSSTNPSDMTGDPFCFDGTYESNTSQCEAGEWKWGSFTVELPDMLKTISTITYMQDMTPQICGASTENETKRLIDKRDGKYYWVAKLKDGNCWMTQNLELDLSTSTPLTSELSDVTSSWTPANSTYESATEGGYGSNFVQSWDLGEVVWKDPDNSGRCDTSDNLYNSSCSSSWQDVSSGWAPMAEYRTDGVTYDASTQTYDTHYLAGNYYSWEAATAGTGHAYASEGAQAPDSICPKGFELPTAGDYYGSYNTTPGSFFNLFNQYGLTDSDATTIINNIVKDPLFFVSSSYVFVYDDYVPGAGTYGYYWSSISSNNTSSAYVLYFSASGISSFSKLGVKQDGYPVRCVAPSA